MKRNCDNCIFAQRSGGCVSWNCEPIPIREAAKAWKVIKESDRYFQITRRKERSEKDAD